MIIVTSVMSLFIYLAYSALFTIAPESFPTRIRGIGTGILGIFSRIGGIVTPIITGYLLESENGFEITIILFSVFYLACGLLIILLKETRPIKKKKKVNLL